MLQSSEFSFFIQQLQLLSDDQLQKRLAEMRQNYNKMPDQQLGFVMYKLSQNIMKLKGLSPKMSNFFQQCIKDMIQISIKRNFQVGTQSLRNIFNLQAQYYRHNKLDLQLKHPIGLKRQVYTYQPQVGQQCDIVKPYLSASMYCGWTRCTVISKDNKKYVVMYANTQQPAQTKQQPLCAPLGTRTDDFQWRMNLNIGQIVDGFHKVWFKGTIADRYLQNGSWKVRITFKIYSENGKYIDKHGQRYDGLGDDDDQVYDILSYRIQKPGKMSKKLCQYSAVAQQFVLDDTYDLIFEKIINKNHLQEQ